ncbi:MAG: hypothetical protein KGZ96_06375 [Clostridia bacterium]|jgi:lantibiotic modifying enzyme|nr:hypothetical protein [Clostridia bacterium]
MKPGLNEVWELITNLPYEEKKIIYKRMQDEVNSKLNDLLDKVNERTEQEPVEFDIITKEVEIVREKHHG